MLGGLPTGQEIHYTVDFLDLADYRSRSEPLTGHFRTPPAQDRDIRFLWSGDNVGQGWGINPDIGGMPIYRRMAGLQPDFFIHSGDTIYADNPLSASVTLEDGQVWRNLVTEEKSRVAESLDDFRGQYRYNLLDDGFRDFYRNVPVIAQWDDHEVTNNWFWELRRSEDPRYSEPSVARLAARAMRAFQEYIPTRRHPLDPERLYDRFAYGPALEVFRIDLRSYRGPNSDDQPTTLSPESRILGRTQLRWLKRSAGRIHGDLEGDRLGHAAGRRHLRRLARAARRRGHRPARWAPAGRELEIAELLTFVRDQPCIDIRCVAHSGRPLHGRPLL